MKEYVNTFLHYRFLLKELVKRNQTEVQTFLSWYRLVPFGAIAYHDGTDDRVWYFVWK